MGAWGEKKMRGRTYMGIIRTTVIVDTKGKILKVYPKVKARGHAEQVGVDLELLHGTHAVRVGQVTIGGDAPIYYGVGGRLHLQEDGDSKVGLRMPIGMDFTFDNGRFDVFVEIAPIFDFVPETEFDLSGGVGARYYF